MAVTSSRQQCNPKKRNLSLQYLIMKNYTTQEHQYSIKHRRRHAWSCVSSAVNLSVVKKDLKIDSDRTSKVGDGGGYAAAGAFNRSDGVGVYAGAGLGRDEWDGGEGKGPNVGAGAEFSLARGARAVVNADLVRVSQSVGPVKATLGLSAETGGTISPTQVEAKVLGTGFSLGRKVGFSILGNGFEFKLW